MWAAAAAAVRPGPVRKPTASMRGRVPTTLAGLAAAMEKVRAAAGTPSLRRLADSSEAAGRLRRGVRRPERIPLARCSPPARGSWPDPGPGPH
jgi:hypothetical protein